MYKLIIIYSYVVYRRYCLSAWRGTGPLAPPAAGRQSLAAVCGVVMYRCMHGNKLSCATSRAPRRRVSQSMALLTYLLT